MTTLEILPFILFIVVVVTALSERINVPYPLLLVIAGLIVGFIPGVPNWHPPSDSVLALFLPPILFSAARLISWRDIRARLSTISSLSIVLVIITTFCIAYILNAFVPQVTFSTALVLGAIISPTDTVAACTILEKMNVRQSIIRTLKVESLFNDAMGIVLYKMALVMVVMGSLSTNQLTEQTLYVGIGGIMVGFVFAYFTGLIVEQFLSHSENELPIIMSLILAYVAYLFADRIGVSSVLAVVSAGLYHRRTESTIDAKIRLSETTVWSTLIFFLNGIIFITIGIQFPTYLKKVDFIPTADLILFSLLTICVLIGLRVVWLTLTAYGTRAFYRLRKKTPDLDTLSFRPVLVMAWAGMRGLVSLALAIAIPTSFVNGTVFPFRNLIIFLTMITILFTLVVQGLSLPYLIRRLGLGKDDVSEQLQIQAIYDHLTRKTIEAIRRLNQQAHNYSDAAIKLVENYYANRLLHVTLPNESATQAHQVRIEAANLLTQMLTHERKHLNTLRNNGEISEEIYIKLVRKMDRDEVGFASYG